MPRIEQLIQSVLTDACELPDRTSPEDWPEAMLITGSELDGMLRAFAAKVASLPLDDLRAIVATAS